MRLLTLLVLTCMLTNLSAAPIPLFDGKTLNGWEGETKQVWRVEDGAIVGGSLDGNPRNEFLATTKKYRNFHLRFEYKLVGTQGFVNGGVQFRSKRIKNPPNEMSGYQADIGAGWTGSLYDESRRRKMLAKADKALIQRIEKKGEWNSYEVVAAGRQILLFVNGQRTSIFVEGDPKIDQDGVIALQIHGNCKAEISFRNITIEQLPEAAIPPQGEILSRFGQGQPVAPFSPFIDGKFKPIANEVIAFVGQENFVREQRSGELEANLAIAFAGKQLRFRSMAWEADTVYEQWRDLNFGAWRDQLDTTNAGTVIAQFGQMEAFDGVQRITEFKTAYHRLLDQFAARTRRVVLVSPMPFERPLASHAPDLTKRNDDVAAYTQAVADVARERDAVFIDLFSALSNTDKARPRLTDDGIHLNKNGLRIVSKIIAEELGAKTDSTGIDRSALQDAIVEKNRLWFDCWRPGNWSFVYGDRINQMYGKAGGQAPSLKESFELRRPLIDSLDQHIHAVAADKESSRPELPSLLKITQSPKALSPEDQHATFETAPGYQVNLFASERDGVINPVQIAWDERGRLYVACSPTYPQTLAAAKPADFILVLEDTDHDGKADKSWRFAEGLTMIQGLEPGPDGLYVCDFDKLLYIRDTDGDGRGDQRQTIFSGFGIGDTHQLVNSISHGPDGSLWFTQGLHAMSLVETPWGIARLDRAGVWRLRPRTLRLEGFFGGGMAGANCWGVAFDDWGQVFHKTGDRPHGYWTVPGMVRGADPQGSGSRTSANQSYRHSPEQYHSVGRLFETSPKTTSLDIVGTRAMPDDIQGTALIGGYFGAVVELHRFHDDGSGYKTTQLPKLMKSSNSAFRPVDVSMGPDGGMYLADWYNPIIGHYQASYADPRRDKHHGRIWRITAKGYDPVRQPNLADMSIKELLDQLKSPERWTRYQTKRLLYYRSTAEVVKAADEWVRSLDTSTPDYERLLLEVIGVYEAHETARPNLLDKLLNAKDFRVRAYGTRMIGAWADQLKDPLSLLSKRVRDDHPRVRLEAAIACSYVPATQSVVVATQVLDAPMDRFLTYGVRQAARALLPLWEPELNSDRLNVTSATQTKYLRDLAGSKPRVASPGEDLYTKACMACHQPEGNGLAGVYPPLAKSDWVTGKPDRIIKVVLHGLQGPINVNGQPFVSAAPIPMPPFGALSDQQVADVVTFVRKSFGNNATPVTPNEVRAVREATQARKTPWSASDFE